MIFSPFTGKDNHGKPVTFGAALLSNEGTESYSWLFKHFVEAMGKAPALIVTDQDRGMRAAIRDVLVGTKHRWCMWHIMLKLSDKIPRRILEDDNLKKEISSCVWSEVLEPSEFEVAWMETMERYDLVGVEWFVTMFDNRAMWVPAYFRDFPMGSLIRTTSVSESENSFYKTFTRPRSNLLEFIMCFDHALAAQRNASSTLDYADSTITPPYSTNLVLEKHAATKYTDHMFKRVQKELVDAYLHCSTDGVLKDEVAEIYTIKDKWGKSWVVTYLICEDSYSCSCKLYVREGFLCSHVFLVLKNRFVMLIPDKYFNPRWLKTPLPNTVVDADVVADDSALPPDAEQQAKNKASENFYSFMSKFDGHPEVIDYFAAGVERVGKNLMEKFAALFTGESRQREQDFYPVDRPVVVEVQTPEVVSTKGGGSTTAARLVSAKENVVKFLTKPLRKCRKCGKLGRHDKRTCGKEGVPQ